MRTYRRMIIAYPLRRPDPALQPGLPFDPEQAAAGDLSIAERWEKFYEHNPHVYQTLREMALADARCGARRISVKLLFERLRALGVATATDGDEYRLNNDYTSRVARMLAAEQGLAGLIELRALKAE